MKSGFAGITAKLRRYFDGQHERDDWVIAKLRALPAGAILLDAGAGSQKYRAYCGHLEYRAQDFGGVTLDQQDGFAGLTEHYTYGQLDYSGNIWSIDAKDATFDAILCTEVFEHIPYPHETLKEFSRLLKPNGKLILTAPFASLRHMDPYFFCTGFSDRWYEHFMPEYGFRLSEMKGQGDYNRSVAVEIFRTIRMNRSLSTLWRIPLLLPALGVFFLASLKPTPQSIATAVIGYFVVAEKEDAAQ